MTRRTTIDEIIAMSPVPIFFQDMKKLASKHYFAMTPEEKVAVKNGEMYGVFVVPSHLLRHYKKYNHGIIFVEKALNDQFKHIVLFHELGHALYYFSRKKNNQLASEKYAITYCLKTLLAEKMADELRCAMEDVGEYASHKDYFAHGVAKNIMKSKLWGKCEKYTSPCQKEKT